MSVKEQLVNFRAEYHAADNAEEYIPCTGKENQQYQQDVRRGTPLPDHIVQIKGREGQFYRKSQKLDVENALMPDEIREFLQYKTMERLDEQNRHLSAIREIIAWMSTIVLSCIAIGCLACLIMLAKDSPFPAFISFILMLVFGVLAVAVFSLRKE